MKEEENSKFSLNDVHCKTEREDGVDILSVNVEDLQDINTGFSSESLKGSTEENVSVLNIELDKIKKEDISKFLENTVPCEPEVENKVDTPSIKVEDNFCKEEFSEDDLLDTSHLEVDERSQDQEPCSSTRSRRGFTRGKTTADGRKLKEVDERVEGFTLSLPHERVHNGKKLFTYKVCSKSFSSNSHTKGNERSSAAKKPYQCDICSKTFVEKRNLVAHIFAHTGEKPFNCKVCLKSFASVALVKKHEKIHAPKEFHAEEKQFECDVCSKIFSSAYFLKTHKRLHTGEKPFECNLCPSTFYSSSYLKRHERTHTGEKPFQCDKCFKSFARNTDLTSHKWIHTEEKPFKCELCPKSFCASIRLKVHQKIHGENPFKCKICSKSFPLAYYLKAHQWAHVEEKPFKCEVCSKSFHVNSRLIVHRRIHSGEKPFECKYCSKTFSIRSNCVKHEKTHTGEHSKLSTESVAKKSRLEKLKKIDSGKVKDEKPGQKHAPSEDCMLGGDTKIFVSGDDSEDTKDTADSNVKAQRAHVRGKPIKCEICSKTFRVNSRLIVHRRIHTGEKPFECKFCSKSFSIKSNCVKHEKMHKGKRSKSSSEPGAKNSNLKKHEKNLSDNLNDEDSDQKYVPSGEFIWSGDTKIFVMGDGSEEAEEMTERDIKEEFSVNECTGELTTNEDTKESVPMGDIEEDVLAGKEIIEIKTNQEQEWN